MSKASKPAVVPSLAASVILLSPLKQVAPDGYNYRIVLLKRRSKGTFGSALVFPGGNVDAADASPEWDSFLPVRTDEERRARTVRIAGVRETFEECGILLEQGGQGLPVSDVLSWRDRVHTDANAFRELFRSRGSIPCTSALALRSNWLTPKGNPKRFDTYFYLALAPPASNDDKATLSTGSDKGETADEAHVVAADGKETLTAEWLTPGEALRRAFAKEAKLLPPQVYTLGDLPQDYRQLFVPDSGNALVSLKPAKWEVRLAEVTADDGSMRVATVLPGDPEYGRPPTASDKMARHRNYLSPPKEGKGMFDVLGCQRRGMGPVLGEAWQSEIRAGNVFGTHSAKL